MVRRAARRKKGSLCIAGWKRSLALSPPDGSFPFLSGQTPKRGLPKSAKNFTLLLGNKIIKKFKVISGVDFNVTKELMEERKGLGGKRD